MLRSHRAGAAGVGRDTPRRLRRLVWLIILASVLAAAASLAMLLSDSAANVELGDVKLMSVPALSNRERVSENIAHVAPAKKAPLRVSAPAVSFVVTWSSDSNPIDSLLRSIQRQGFPSVEIIIVDASGGGVDSSAPFRRAFNRVRSPPSTDGDDNGCALWVNGTHPHSGYKGTNCTVFIPRGNAACCDVHGPACAYDCGIRFARGLWVALVDADTYLDDNFYTHIKLELGRRLLSLSDAYIHQYYSAIVATELAVGRKVPQQSTRDYLPPASTQLMPPHTDSPTCVLFRRDVLRGALLGTVPPLPPHPFPFTGGLAFHPLVWGGKWSMWDLWMRIADAAPFTKLIRVPPAVLWRKPIPRSIPEVLPCLDTPAVCSRVFRIAAAGRFAGGYALDALESLEKDWGVVREITASTAWARLTNSIHSTRTRHDNESVSSFVWPPSVRAYVRVLEAVDNRVRGNRTVALNMLKSVAGDIHRDAGGDAGALSDAARCSVKIQEHADAIPANSPQRARLGWVRRLHPFRSLLEVPPASAPAEACRCALVHELLAALSARCLRARDESGGRSRRNDDPAEVEPPIAPAARQPEGPGLAQESNVTNSAPPIRVSMNSTDVKGGAVHEDNSTVNATLPSDSARATNGSNSTDPVRMASQTSLPPLRAAQEDAPVGCGLIHMFAGPDYRLRRRRLAAARAVASALKHNPNATIVVHYDSAPERDLGGSAKPWFSDGLGATLLETLGGLLEVEAAGQRDEWVPRLIFVPVCLEWHASRAGVEDLAELVKETSLESDTEVRLVQMDMDAEESANKAEGGEGGDGVSQVKFSDKLLRRRDALLRKGLSDKMLAYRQLILRAYGGTASDADFVFVQSLHPFVSNHHVIAWYPTPLELPHHQTTWDESADIGAVVQTRMPNAPLFEAILAVLNLRARRSRESRRAHIDGTDGTSIPFLDDDELAVIIESESAPRGSAAWLATRIRGSLEAVYRGLQGTAQRPLGAKGHTGASEAIQLFHVAHLPCPACVFTGTAEDREVSSVPPRMAVYATKSYGCPLSRAWNIIAGEAYDLPADSDRMRAVLAYPQHMDGLALSIAEQSCPSEALCLPLTTGYES